MGKAIAPKIMIGKRTASTSGELYVTMELSVTETPPVVRPVIAWLSACQVTSDSDSDAAYSLSLVRMTPNSNLNARSV